MRIYCLILFLLTGLLKPDASAQAPGFAWATQLGGPDEDSNNSVAVDPAGNVYVTGYFNDTATIGTNALVSSGETDVFIARYSPAGQLSWAVRAGGSGQDIAVSIATDAAGNCYITGGFNGTATFGNVTLTAGNTNTDSFVAKYDTAGNTLWAVKMSGSGHDAGNAIAVDQAGNCYVTGFFYTNITIGSATFTASQPVYGELYLAKYSPSGNVLWAKHGSGQGTGKDVKTDRAGNCYLTGHFANNLLLSTQTLASMGNEDVFLAKYDGTGSLLWATRAGGPSYEQAEAIALDTAGNCYMTGGFYGMSIMGTTNLIDQGQSDMFVTKFGPAGTVIWARSAGGPGGESARSIAADQEGNLYVTGNFGYSSQSTSGGMALFGSTMLVSQGSADVYIAHFSALGNVLWVQQGGGGTALVTALDIALDGQGNSYVCGMFQDSVRFQGIAFHEYGFRDAYLVKLGAVVTSVQPELEKDPVSLFPNPAHDQLRIRFSTNSDAFVRVTILNSLGESVLENRQPATTDQSIKEISLAGFVPGFYTVQIYSGEKVITRKLLIE